MEKELIEEYRRLRTEKTCLKDQLSSCQEELEKVETEIVDYLNDHDKTRSATYEGIGFVSLVKPSVFVSYNKDNEEDVFHYLKEKDAESLIKRTVNSISLKSFIAQQIEEGADIPQFINYYTKQTIKLYKGK